MKAPLILLLSAALCAGCVSLPADEDRSARAAVVGQVDPPAPVEAARKSANGSRWFWQVEEGKPIEVNRTALKVIGAVALVAVTMFVLQGRSPPPVQQGGGGGGCPAWTDCGGLWVIPPGTN